MHHDQNTQEPKPLNLRKVTPLGSPQETAGAATLGSTRETPVQIVLSDGLPAAIGGLAAMTVAGAALLPGLAVALLSGVAFTLVRNRSQR